LVLSVRKGMRKDRDEMLRRLVDIQYTRNDFDFQRGTFRVRGDTVEIFPAGATDKAVRIELFGDEVDRILQFDVLTGRPISEMNHVMIYPAKHYVVKEDKMAKAIESIEEELELRLKELRDQGKILEAYRLEQRTKFDLEMLQEMGYCPGIENYSRHLTQRAPGQPPYTLLDFFPDDFIVVIDESHVTIPQLRAMYEGDRSRKQSLVNYGFRLPSAFDNRPLTFDEFMSKIGQVIYVSATPGPFELEVASQVVEQVVRPTGLIDPEIQVRPTENQIDDLIAEIREAASRNERVLVTTLTKRMAEDLTEYLREIGIKVTYMHSDVKTLERMEIIRDLRLGVFDVLVGINLLREGLDLPEVSRVCILDADREGFLRSETSLIQTIGRAARNVNGKVIMYADTVTGSMERAIRETERRRAKQKAYNEKHGIVPQSIKKDIRDVIAHERPLEEEKIDSFLREKSLKDIPKKEIPKVVDTLVKEMKEASANLEFERAAILRDMIFELEQSGVEIPSLRGKRNVSR